MKMKTKMRYHRYWHYPHMIWGWNEDDVYVSQGAEWLQYILNRMIALAIYCWETILTHAWLIFAVLPASEEEVDGEKTPLRVFLCIKMADSTSIDYRSSLRTVMKPSTNKKEKRRGKNWNGWNKRPYARFITYMRHDIIPSPLWYFLMYWYVIMWGMQRHSQHAANLGCQN